LKEWQSFWPVQHIKYLPTEDQVYSLREGSGLAYSDVSNALIRPPEDIPSEAAEYRPATGNRIFIIDKATIWNKRRRNKGFRVEELVDPAAYAATATGVLEGRPRSQVGCCVYGCGTKQRAGETV
jgi:hypothetical protein